MFDVGSGKLQVTAGGQELGSWSLDSIAVEPRADGLHVSLDGERVVVNVNDEDGFVAEVAPPRKKGRRSRPKNRKKPKERKARPETVTPAAKIRQARARSAQKAEKPTTPAIPEFQPELEMAPEPRQMPKPEGPSLRDRLSWVPELFVVDNWREWLQDTTVRWAIASAGVIVFALLALFATNTLGMILVLVGMVALIVAALVMSDDLSAYAWLPSAISETALVIAGGVAMLVGAIFILLG